MKLKKLSILTIFIFGITYAQEDLKINIQKNQFSFQTNIINNNYNNNDMFKLNTKDFTFSYLRNLNSETSIGISLNYNSQNGISFFNYNNINFSENQNYNSKGISFNFNYDWSKLIGINTNKIDIFTGTSLGVSVLDNYYLNTPVKGIQTWDKVTSNQYFIGAQFGVRYWLTKNIGISTELNNSFYDALHEKDTKLNIGINYKF